MQNMFSQIQSSEPTTVLNMVISLMHWMFYTVGYPFAAVGNFWYHPSPLWACSTTGTYAVWLGWRLWLVHEDPPYQLNHGQVDKQVLVLRLHHGRTLLAHFLNNAVHTEVLGNSLGQRSEVRGQSEMLSSGIWVLATSGCANKSNLFTDWLNQNQPFTDLAYQICSLALFKQLMVCHLMMQDNYQ